MATTKYYSNIPGIGTVDEAWITGTQAGASSSGGQTYIPLNQRQALFDQYKWQETYDETGKVISSPALQETPNPTITPTVSGSMTTPNQTTVAPTITPATSPPSGGQTYTVKSGDTLSAIAAKLGVPMSSISGYRSGNPNLIYPNEVLTIGGGVGGGTSTPTEAKPTGWLMTNKSVGKISPGGQWIYTGEFKNGPYGTNGAIVEAWVGEWIPNTKNTGTSPTGQTGATGANVGGTPPATPPVDPNVQKDETIKNLQNLLDAGQDGSTSALTGDTVTKPVTPDSTTAYEDLKTKYSTEPLETELADLNKQYADIWGLYEKAKVGEGQRLAPMAIINLRKNAVSAEQQIELQTLSLKINAVQNQLDAKYKTIDTIMNLNQQTYENSRSAYEFEINKALQNQQLLNQTQDNNRATLIAVSNLLKDVSWDDIPTDMQNTITKLEMSAGFPVGVMKAFTNENPGVEVKWTNKTTDANGNEIMQFFGTDSSGNPVLIKGIQTGGVSAGAEETNISIQLNNSKGTDGFVDPGVYQNLKETSEMSPTEFDARYANRLSPQEQQNLGVKTTGVNSEDIDYLTKQVLNRQLELTSTALTKEQKSAILSNLAQKGLNIPRTLTGAEKTAQNNATAGLNAIDDIDSFLLTDPNLVYKGALPGFLASWAGASSFNTARDNAKDVITRIRTGAALNEQEITFYNSMIPKWGDKANDVTYKLTQLRALYLGVSGLSVTIVSPKGEEYILQDLYNATQRQGLRDAIKNGYKLIY
jgi:LysM repeat protein